MTPLKLKDIENLEEIFAILTENGWVIPDWLIELRRITETKNV